MPGFRFHDLRHTAATLAAASGTSLRALMARIGHASARAALRYKDVIDGQDADIVAYLERFGNEPPQAARDRKDPEWGTPPARTVRNGSTENEDRARDEYFCGGDDRTRTDDPLLAKHDQRGALTCDDSLKPPLTCDFGNS
jgi:hypothetical protein